MRYNSAYTLDIKSFGNQGVQISISTKFGVLNLTAILALFSCLLYFYVHVEDKLVHQINVYLAVSMALISVWIIYQLLSKIHKETVLIVSTLGLTVKRESLLSSSTRYFDLQHIKDIVIIEAVSMHSIICQLVLLPKTTSSSDKKVETLHPLFQSFRPSIEDLKTIYRQVQTTLMIPSNSENR